jgi:hypothetical protein
MLNGEGKCDGIGAELIPQEARLTIDLEQQSHPAIRPV